MDDTFIIALLVIPALLAAAVAGTWRSLGPASINGLRPHAVSACVGVPLLLGVVATGLREGLEGAPGVALLSAAEIGVAYALLVGFWAVRLVADEADAALR